MFSVSCVKLWFTGLTFRPSFLAARKLDFSFPSFSTYDNHECCAWYLLVGQSWYRGPISSTFKILITPPKWPPHQFWRHHRVPRIQISISAYFNDVHTILFHQATSHQHITIVCLWGTPWPQLHDKYGPCISLLVLSPASPPASPWSQHPCGGCCAVASIEFVRRAKRCPSFHHHCVVDAHHRCRDAH